MEYNSFCIIYLNSYRRLYLVLVSYNDIFKLRLN